MGCASPCILLIGVWCRSSAGGVEGVSRFVLDPRDLSFGGITVPVPKFDASSWSSGEWECASPCVLIGVRCRSSAGGVTVEGVSWFVLDPQDLSFGGIAYLYRFRSSTPPCGPQVSGNALVRASFSSVSGVGVLRAGSRSRGFHGSSWTRKTASKRSRDGMERRRARRLVGPVLSRRNGAGPGA